MLRHPWQWLQCLLWHLNLLYVAEGEWESAQCRWLTGAS